MAFSTNFCPFKSDLSGFQKYAKFAIFNDKYNPRSFFKGSFCTNFFITFQGLILYVHPTLEQTYSLLSKDLFCTFIQHLYKCIHNFPRSNFVRSFNFIIAFRIALRLTIRTRLLSKITESFIENVD